MGVTGRKPSAFLHEAGPTHQAPRAGPPEQGSCPATGGNRTFSSFLLSAELVLMAGWPAVSDQGEASRRAFSRAEDKVCPIVLSKSKCFSQLLGMAVSSPACSPCLAQEAKGVPELENVPELVVSSEMWLRVNPHMSMKTFLMQAQLAQEKTSASSQSKGQHFRAGLVPSLCA